jgi:hypothetical protein
MNAPKSAILMMAATIYAVLAFLLYGYLYSGSAMPTPLSLDAFIQPFYSLDGMIIGIIALLDLAYYQISVFPMATKLPKLHTIAIVFPAVIAILGFIVGFLHLNFWVSIPFLLIGFINTLYAYSKIS